MAATQLPGAMGPIYAKVTVACLTCLDRGNNGFGNEEGFMDEDGISVGVRYVEKVLLPLSGVSVMIVEVLMKLEEISV